VSELGPQVEIHLEGEAEFKAAIDRAVAAVGKQNTEPILWGAAAVMLKRLKENVAAINRVSGRLRGAPARRWGKDTAWGQPRAPIVYMSYRGGKAAPHAHLVEYGGRGGQMPAQPYFRPAYDATKDEMIRHVESEIIKAVEGAWYK
jgi:hypothetical protein